LLSAEQQTRILALATDFPKLWGNPNTPDRERKRMVRLLLEDVTLIKRQEITAHVRFKGGVVKTITLPLPLNGWQKFRTNSEVLREIDRLLDGHTGQEIADILNHRGFRPGKTDRFNCGIINRIQKANGLQSRYDRLRALGMLTRQEIARLLGITEGTVHKWWKHGLLLRHDYSDRGDCLYEHPGPHAPVKRPGLKLAERRRLLGLDAQAAKGVQCEA
jgi:hypothetical protein